MQHLIRVNILKTREMRLQTSLYFLVHFLIGFYYIYGDFIADKLTLAHIQNVQPIRVITIVHLPQFYQVFQQTV